jgi:acyl-coenzyme A synthetase/AMP-(fatty) acid ligase
MIGFTSGSTGKPKTYPKSWGSVHASTALNAGAIRRALAIAGHEAMTSVPAIVATVPPQHMYGMELSVLLPLIGGMAVHAGRPLFPADIALALGELPSPRVLVSTPLHLRTLVESSQAFPETAVIVSATAPLDRELAVAVEARLGGQLLEMFGSTETCVVACRRTATEDTWRAYDGVELRPMADGTLVSAAWFVEPTLLQDVVELRSDARFAVRGRSSDMIEVAGKRASLSDLTRRLLAIEGVRDAVLFQPQPDSVAKIRRLAALVVAPGCSARQIRERLAGSVDPAFLPRPLRIVDSLPRNELGKLPREQLLEMLKR